MQPVHVTLGGALERVGELAAATFQQALVFTIGRRPGGRKQPLESFPNWPNGVPGDTNRIGWPLIPNGCCCAGMLTSDIFLSTRLRLTLPPKRLSSTRDWLLPPPVQIVTTCPVVVVPIDEALNLKAAYPEVS